MKHANEEHQSVHHAHRAAGGRTAEKTSQPGREDHRRHFRLAVSATVHCLAGCGIGEVAGMAIATALGMGMISSMALAIALGFIAGLTLGIVPLLRSGFEISNALRTVIVAEGLSIAVMEGFEVLTQVLIPGVMESGLTDAIFWAGMLAGLAVGFIAALPVNFLMIKRGVRHSH